MKIHKGVKRLRGSIPKIGIRPTIDGRERGVRESLEEQTMNLARDVANTYIDELNNILNLSSLKMRERKIKFLEKQMSDAEIRLSAEKLELVNFQKKTKILDPSRQTRWTMELYTKLLSQKTDLQVKLKNLESALSPGSPEVNSLKDQISMVNSKIKQFEGTNDFGELPTFKNIPDKLSKFNELSRKLKITNKIYETLLKLYEQARYEESQDTLYVQIIDPAIKPVVKSKPNRTKIVITATFASFILSIFIIFFTEWFKSIRESYYNELKNQKTI